MQGERGLATSPHCHLSEAKGSVDRRSLWRLEDFECAYWSGDHFLHSATVVGAVEREPNL